MGDEARAVQLLLFEPLSHDAHCVHNAWWATLMGTAGTASVPALCAAQRASPRPSSLCRSGRRVLRWRVPLGATFFQNASLRVDSGVQEGDTVGWRAAHPAVCGPYALTA